MDKSLYEIMQEIYAQKKTEFSKDIKLIGTLTSEEDSPNGKVLVTNDVFLIIDEMPDGTTSQRFVITGLDKDGKIYPAQEIAQDDISFLAQFQNMNKVEVVSLNETDKKLDSIAKELGISKKDIRSMSEIDLDQAIAEKEKEDKKGPKISLDDKDHPEEDDKQKKENNETALRGASKQEINLDERVDDRYTLADIFGVPAGCKLLAVFSDNIENNKNTTRFSCIIQTADGKLMPADMLTQVGGKHSDKTIYDSNWDGSEVEKESVNSSYTINSPIIKNGIITIRYGSMGRAIVSYGRFDQTEHKVGVTQELRGREVFHRTERAVLDEFDVDKGIYHTSEQVDEIKGHPEDEFSDGLINIKDINGRVDDTDHTHNEQVIQLIVSDEDVGQRIRDNYNDETIMQYLDKTIRENNGRDFESIIEMTKYALKADMEKEKASSEEEIDEIDAHSHDHGHNS